MKTLEIPTLNLSCDLTYVTLIEAIELYREHYGSDPELLVVDVKDVFTAGELLNTGMKEVIRTHPMEGLREALFNIIDKPRVDMPRLKYVSTHSNFWYLIGKDGMVAVESV